jgi:DNA-binding transcriptional regulator YdaS (Cro superfamily)
MLLSAEQIRKQESDQIDALLAWVGTSKRLATILGVSVQAIYSMRKRGRISKRGATIIHIASDGRFDRDLMRPDVVTWTEEV